MKIPNADEHGNFLPELDPTSDVAQIIYLLEYGRKRGFRIGPTVQVGNAIVQVSDLSQEREAADASVRAEPTIWQENGHDDSQD